MTPDHGVTPEAGVTPAARLFAPPSTTAVWRGDGFAGWDAGLIWALGWLNPGQAARFARPAPDPAGAAATGHPAGISGPSDGPEIAALVADPGVQERRAHLVAALHAESPGPEIIQSAPPPADHLPGEHP